MAEWLQQVPTILVNLGTLYAPDPEVAQSIATGLRMFLVAWKGRKVQILWKLPKHPSDADNVYDEAVKPLEHEIRSDNVRVCPWLVVEPLAMLETGQIACSVHHGGANSWYEAIQ
jgi:2-acylglycerol O-acyltransferase 1